MPDYYKDALARYERDGSGYIPDAEAPRCLVCGAVVDDACDEGCSEVICYRCLCLLGKDYGEAIL